MGKIRPLLLCLGQHGEHALAQRLCPALPWRMAIVLKDGRHQRGRCLDVHTPVRDQERWRPRKEKNDPPKGYGALQYHFSRSARHTARFFRDRAWRMIVPRSTAGGWRSGPPA